MQPNWLTVRIWFIPNQDPSSVITLCWPGKGTLKARSEITEIVTTNTFSEVQWNPTARPTCWEVEWLQPVEIRISLQVFTSRISHDLSPLFRTICFQGKEDKRYVGFCQKSGPKDDTHLMGLIIIKSCWTTKLYLRTEFPGLCCIRERGGGRDQSRRDVSVHLPVWELGVEGPDEDPGEARPRPTPGWCEWWPSR